VRRMSVQIDWTTNQGTLGETLCRMNLWVSGKSVSDIDRRANRWFRKTVSFVSPFHSYEIIIRDKRGHVMSELSRFAG
jgi:hypothetical protein